MAGPQDIQRFPKGLIDLLGMRATGDTPNKLSQEIGGELDLKDEYLLDRMVGLRASTPGPLNSLGNSGFATAVVPDGQNWYLYNLSVEVPATAAATALTLTLSIARGAFNVRQLVGPAVKLGALEGSAWGVTFEKAIILRPGDALGIYVSQLTGVPGSVATGMLNYAAVGI